MPEKKHILFIAYTFPPDKKVGALRIAYWNDELSSKYPCETEVITAEQNAQGSGIHYVPMEGSSSLSALIKDEGLIWKKNVQSYLEQSNLQPDFVVITGGPFMQFRLTKWLKKRFNCKVILDYRDPFADNPGYANSGIKKAIKKFFERKFNRAADALLTVNKYCGDLVVDFHSKSNAIIQNGYDERVSINSKPVELGKSSSFSYTGKLYFDPGPMAEAFKAANLQLTYAGGNSDQLAAYPHIESLGFVHYEEAQKLVATKDVGVIQTLGMAFQSTTKIFDYLRFKRAILIISNKDIAVGSMKDELENYPNVFWAKNTVSDISSALEEIKISSYEEPNDEFALRNSRGRQMEGLIKLLRELEA